MPASNMDDGSDFFPNLSGYRFERAFVCPRCAIWKGLYKATYRKRDALMHLIESHPYKLLDALDCSGLIRVTDIELEQILVDTKHKGD